MRPILAVRTDDYQPLREPSLFSGSNIDVIADMFDDNLVAIVDRDKVEDNPAYKQLIPYVVIVDKSNHVLVYARGNSGGESRLHEKTSIGIGGHIDYDDKEYRPRMIDVAVAAYREISEELGVTPVSLAEVGVIEDNSDAVGKVHLGLAYIARVNVEEFEPEDCIRDIRMVSLDRLEQEKDRLETWSRILLDSGVLEAFLEENSEVS